MKTPIIKPTRYARALVLQPVSLDRPNEGRVYRVDHRALERSKYAPWGCGHASGLKGHVKIPAGNR